MRPVLLFPHRWPHHSLEIPGQARPHGETVTIPGGRLGYRGAGFILLSLSRSLFWNSWGLLFEGLYVCRPG